MKIDTKTMSPWHEINQVMSNMRSLSVAVGKETFAGSAELVNDNGDITLKFPAKKRSGKGSK